MSKATEAIAWNVSLDVTRPNDVDDETWTQAVRGYVVAFLGLSGVNGAWDVVEESVTRDDAAASRYPNLYDESAPYLIHLKLERSERAQPPTVRQISADGEVPVEPEPEYNGLPAMLLGLAIVWLGSAIVNFADARWWQGAVAVVGGILTALTARVAKDQP